ncbi:MAG: LysR family transcriptional regulator [Acidobacteriota bacterium]|nr:LysR family transcriptional regulator [Acidobacteriota bacterium]
MLDLQKLESFRMVANTRSFTRAAVELGYSQSTVTSHIQALERDVGAPLFERVRFSREIALTEIGRRTLEHAGRLLALADETSIAIHAQSDPAGLLKVCASPLLLAYRLSAILRRYQLQNPHVHLSLSSYCDPRMLGGSVLNGVADVAFVFDERIVSDRVVSESLGRERLLVVCSPEHPLAQCNAVADMGDLARHQALFIDPHCPIRAVLMGALVSAGERIERAMEVGGLAPVKQCVAATLGYTVLPLFAVERELESRELVVVPVPGFEPDLEIQMVRTARSWVSPAVRALWSMVSPGSTVASAA